MTDTAQEKKFPVTEDIKEAMALIKRGTDTLLVEEELEQKLARSKATGKPLRIKLGLDPTAPDIHLGHTVRLEQTSPIPKPRSYRDLPRGRLHQRDRRPLRAATPRVRPHHS